MRAHHKTLQQQQRKRIKVRGSEFEAQKWCFSYMEHAHDQVEYGSVLANCQQLRGIIRRTHSSASEPAEPLLDMASEERGRIKYEQQESGKGKIDLKPRIAVSYFIFKGDELLVFYLFTYIRPSEKGCGAL
ncbi:hypothetical protein AXG93_3524s1050 [Marchantia polymorpha subsp. ruderalis]|uniref:Uncharacterized protein n=1 Tax=Marchantia polymorpha subsp. ruderalis TaxID=1480154 RepID=A0A176WRN1_MARPO|nr:hypothetical protein AXG93_3524s1050 [Marchantia polymorpha subsp. ruderalis]